jgi:hypothetical protein
MEKEFIEPVYFNDTVYENKDFSVKRICFWRDCELYWKNEVKLFSVALPGCTAFNVTGCKATFALEDGKRATDKEFCYVDGFEEGLCLVGITGKGFGYIDSKMDFVIPPKYNNAKRFQNGFALVAFWDNEKEKNTWIFIDKQGVEYHFEKEYAVIENNSDGIFRVSDLDMGGFWGFFSLAFHSDYHSNAGLWGYVDSAGKEIIKPQYIYAFDFENGYARVCKGEWTKDKKWDNEYNTGRYWTETELWGFIDKTGKEVIPCRYDEIKYFYENSKYLQAHIGGWENGKWGIIDYNGNWIVEPIFEDLDYDISTDGCFAFYNEDKWSAPDEIPMGIYSIAEQRVIFEPQFLDVDFLDDGFFRVEKYDEKLNRNIQMVIDKTGKPLFDSVYTDLFNRNNYYETVIRDKNGNQLYGIIDKAGNELLSCKYNATWNGLLFPQKLIVFKQDEKCGVMSFDGNIIIEPNYTSLMYCAEGFFEAKIGGKEGHIDEGKVGLLDMAGNIVLPITYKSVSIENELICAQDDSGATLFKIIRNRTQKVAGNSA